MEQANKTVATESVAAKTGWPEILGAIWILSIAGYWGICHWVWTAGPRPQPIQLGALWASGTLGRALLPILAVFCAAGAAVAARRFLVGRQPGTPIQISIFRLVGLFLLTTLFVLNVNAFLRTDLGTGGKALPADVWPLANGWFIVRLAVLTATWGLFLTAAHAAGALFLRKFFRASTPPLDAFLYRVAVGLGVWSTVLFFLGVLGVYRWEIVLPLAAGVVVLSRRETVQLLRLTFTARWEAVARGNLVGIVFFLFLLTMAALNAGDLLRPSPVGFDDLNRYVHRAAMMAESRALVPGVFPFPIELLTGLGFLFTDSAMPTMAISWTGGILTGLAILAFARRFWTFQVGLVAAAIFYTLPMVGHLSDFDLKIDLLFCFIAVTAWRAMAEWAVGDAKRPWFVFAAALTGVALTMKLTAVFLLAALSAGALARRERWPAGFVRTTGGLLLAVLFLTLPSVPWTLYNISSREWQWPKNVVEWTTSRASTELRDAEWRSVGLPPPGAVAGTAWKEELERHEAPNQDWRRLLLPWNLTMNVGHNDLYVVIGCLFLAFLPVCLLRNPWRQWTPTECWLALTATVYWVAWALGGMSIPWYALPGFVPLCLGVALFLGKTSDPHWFKALAVGVALASVLAHVTLQADKAAPVSGMRYAAGESDVNTFLEELLPEAQAAARIIEAAPPGQRVLRVGTVVPYFVKSADRRVVEDTYLENFTRLDAGASDATTLQRLQALKIRFVLFDLHINAREADVQGTLHRKANRFVQFAERNLIVRLQEQRSGFALLEVPPASRPQ